MSDAIAKALPTCIFRTRRQVGFALGRKLLLRFTNRLNLLPYFFRQAPICTASADFGHILKRKMASASCFSYGCTHESGLGETIRFPL
jgi:hypothetical protein